jgi:hypothetical protein
MKKLFKPLLFFIIALGFTAGVALAQTTVKQTDKEAKEAILKEKLDSKHFTFIAQYAQPLGGSQKYLTTEYDLRIRPDSVIAYLPYFGRVYMDAPIYPEEAGIMFTSTKFDYTITDRKKKGYLIVINIADNRRTSRFTFDVSEGGYTNLSVTSNNRDPINFTGYIAEDKK